MDFVGLRVFQLRDAVAQHIAKVESEWDGTPETKPPIIKKWKTAKKADLIEIIKANKIDIRKYKLPQKNPKQPLPANILKKYGKKKYTEPEQKEYLNKLIYNPLYKNPLKALKPYTNKEGKSEMLELQTHQTKFIKQMIYSNLRGAVAFHGVGSGKTLTAVVASYLYLKIYPNNKVLVISPSSLLFNFINGMVQYGLDVGDNRYTFTTYDKYIRKPIIARDTLLIVDEAHNFRTEIKMAEMRDPETNELLEEQPRTNLRGAKVMKWGTHYAHKVLLLTGTAFVNGLYDIENLMAMIDNRKPLDGQNYKAVLDDPDNIEDYFSYRISYYKNSDDNEFFPKRKEEWIFTYMTDEMEERYGEIKALGKKAIDPDYDPEDDDELELEYDDNGDPKGKGDPNAYYSAERFASNKVGFPNPKVEWIRKKILENPNEKFIIYSGLMDAGVRLITTFLDANKIGYTSITGTQSTSAKEEAKRYYNGYNYGREDFFDPATIEPQQQKYINDKYRVLIITRAGAEGVDTINTQNIIMLDLVWNDALSEQIIARAIRYKSHHGMPEKDRNVKVWRLLLCFQKDESIVKQISKKGFNAWGEMRLAIRNSVKEAIRNAIIKSGKYVPLVRELQELKTKKGQPYINAVEWAEYKKLQTDDARRSWRNEKYNEYIEENGDADDEEEEQEQIMGNPSADLKMLILSKAKQKAIDEFCALIGNKISVFESFQSRLLPYVIEEEQKLGRSMNEEELVDIYARLLAKEDIDILKTKYSPTNAVAKRTDAVQLQQFFTNPILAEYVIKKSSITDNEEDLVVLEATAGDGALIRPILALEKDIVIEMCEIDTKNREKLEELVKLAPDSLILLAQRNFLRFVPSKRYDYIFMNPPFHIRKSENGALLRDVWDIDFVRRAYAMLKVGGELIAITSTHYTMDATHQHFLSLVGAETEIKKNEKFGTARLDVAVHKIVKESDLHDNDFLAIEYYTEQQNNNSDNINLEITEINNGGGDATDEILIEPPPIDDDHRRFKVDSIADVEVRVNKNFQDTMDWIKEAEARGKAQGRTTYDPNFLLDLMCSLYIYDKYDNFGMGTYTLHSTTKKIKWGYKNYEKDNETLFQDIFDASQINEKILVIPTTLLFEKKSPSSHANTIIINLKTLEIYRFEPHGVSTLHAPNNKKKWTEIYDKEMVAMVKKLNAWLKKKGAVKKRQFVYIPPETYAPVATKIIMDKTGSYKIHAPDKTPSGFQSMENYFDWLSPPFEEKAPKEYKKGKKGDKTDEWVAWKNRKDTHEEGGGWCALWSVFFMELIMKNPEMPLKEVYEKAFYSLDEEPEKYKNFIRGYFISLGEEMEKLTHNFKNIKNKEAFKAIDRNEFDRFYIKSLVERRDKKKADAVARGDYKPLYKVGSGKSGKLIFPYDDNSYTGGYKHLVYNQTEIPATPASRASVVGGGITDTKLYEEAKKIIYNLYKTHSAYRSGAVVKLYKQLYKKKYNFN